MNLSDPEALRRFLKSHGIDPAKGLGQHFLCSASVVKAITDSVTECTGILEIGPGPGVLTAALADQAERVVALELDPRMIAALKKSAPTAEVIKQDALKVNLTELLEGLPAPRAVVSNLPYYITAPLITLVAGARESFEVAVLMMQQEVAKRITAPPHSGSRGSLSVYLQAVFEINLVAEAPAALFYPPPKVDSTVLSFRPKKGAVPSEPLFAFVRMAFTQPRKTLVNNLVAGLNVSKPRAIEIVVSAGLGLLARAQELSLEEWISLRASAETA